MDKSIHHSETIFKMLEKINLTQKLSEIYISHIIISYLLCDSLYICYKVMNSFLGRGFYTIGALKTNRIVYPHGIKCSVSRLAAALKESAFPLHTVTVKERKYNIFRYEGNLNGIDNAVVLISFPVGEMNNPKTLRAFISTDGIFIDEIVRNITIARLTVRIVILPENIIFIQKAVAPFTAMIFILIATDTNRCVVITVVVVLEKSVTAAITSESPVIIAIFAYNTVLNFVIIVIVYGAATAAANFTHFQNLL